MTPRSKSFLVGAICGIAATVLFLVALVRFWPWRVEATAKPGAAELAIMRGILNRAVAREAPRQVAPITESDESLLEGLKLYRDNCAGCHGDGAKMSIWGSTSLLPRVPQFGTDPPARPEWEIRWIVMNGIRNTAMGGFGRLLTEDQIWKLAVFVSRMRSLPNSVANEWTGRTNP